jgi:uncharacterized membrane protein YbaN (DUF454 family)
MNDSIVSEVKISQKPVVRWTLLLAGTVFVGIGILGIFLPLLPTTVFFLMAAWCYSKSSAKFYHWLHHNKLFGKYLYEYRKGAGITPRAKFITIVVLWLSILYSIFYATDLLWIQILLFGIAVGVTIHVVFIPTNRAQQ